MQNFDMEVRQLIEKLEKSQYTYVQIPPPKTKLMTKYDLQKLRFPQNVPMSRTSGSTGIPVSVPKTKESIIWHMATSMREMQWRKWDLSLKKVSILAKNKIDTINGTNYSKSLAPISVLQKYLEEVQPNYLYTYPTIIEKLDLTKLTELLDIKSIGETGATSYSCEEAGTIALQCPINSAVYHIMENIIVESHPEHGAIITDLTNPVITRYILGDIIELETKPCICGRTLPIIKKILGRSRNMLVLPNLDKIWPTIGEPVFYTVTNKIIRHQAIQKTLYDLEIKLQVTEKLTELEEINLVNLIKKSLRYDHLGCNIIYVESFPLGKFEAFKSEL